MPRSGLRHEDESLRPFLYATNDQDGANDGKSSDDPGQRDSFGNEVEDGSYRSDIHNSSWWSRIRFMTLRARKGLGDGVTGKEPAILDLSASSDVDHPKSRSVFDYCIFGGISGFSILAFLLSFNLLLGIANHLWAEDINYYLSAWGKPGSSSEGLSWYPTDFTRDIIPIRCHSHNDYWRRVPLFSAIRAGCTGVEADVWHFNNDDALYVGHNTASLTKNRTFLSLYVNPLVEILEGQNPSTEFYNGTRHGVFDVDSEQSITLLVDLKTGGAETWPYVLEQLQPLRERGWLTYVENGKLVKGPVTVVGTGNTRFDLLTANETYRDVFFDAPLDVMWEMRQGPDGPDWDENERSAEEESRAPLTIESLPADPIAQDGGQGKSGIKPTDEFNPLNSYYASVSFTKSVGILWRGHVTPRQLSIIRGHVRGAHRRGLKVRYWDTPSWPIGMRNHVWDVLIKEGVDMLNVDDLRAASKQVW